MSTIATLFVIFGCIAVSIVAGVITRALQSGADIVGKDGIVRTVPALGRSVINAVLFGVLAAVVALLQVALTANVLVNGEMLPEAVTALATFVASLAAFCVAASTGYGTLVEIDEEVTVEKTQTNNDAA